MPLAGYNLQDNVYIYSNNKCMCVFLISPVPIAEPLTSELIDTPVFYNLAPRPIKYRVSVPIPSYALSCFSIIVSDLRLAATVSFASQFFQIYLHVIFIGYFPGCIKCATFCVTDAPATVALAIFWTLLVASCCFENIKVLIVWTHL